jgi:glycosyltransferase involved in cell wall biosynthesis
MEIVGDAGLLVNNLAELSAGIIKLPEEPATRDKFIAAGKTRARMWSWKKSAQTLHRLLQQVTSGADQKN